MKKTTETSAPAVHTDCRAEFIFYAQTKSQESQAVKVYGEYACDYRRPDWEQRWKDWKKHKNPYLNLFLCGEHARKMGLLKH